MEHEIERDEGVSLEDVRTCEEHWHVSEAEDGRIAVRDENRSLVAWVLPEDAALVAAAPALLSALRALVEARQDPAGEAGTAALGAARALVESLDAEPPPCPACDGMSDAVPVCGLCMGSGILAPSAKVTM